MIDGEEPRSIRHRYAWVWWLLALGQTAGLLWMTMRPDYILDQELSRIILAAQTVGIRFYATVDLIGNIVVFVPVGATVALALRHRRWCDRILFPALVGAALSLCIELLQTFLPTRVPELDDWLLNTGGAALGAAVVYLLHTLIPRLRRRTREHVENPDYV